MVGKNTVGLHRGIVSNIEDPDKRGRIKCLIPDVLGKDTESAWCEPCVTVAYDNGGDFCLPNVKETIWIAFENGDPNKPIYLGNWWQKDKTPLGANYGEDKSKVRVINYANCLITLKDSTVSINVGGGAVDLTINAGNVTIAGNLTVTGTISASTVNATTVNATSSVNAPNIP